MKAMLKVMTLVAVFALAGQAVLAQQPVEGETKKSSGFFEKVFGPGAKTKKPQKDGAAATASSTPRRLEPDDTASLPADVPAETQANRRGMMSEEEAAIVPYYNNFMTSYHLGPEDVISITVFGQERYSRAGITVPPHGRISYPLIPEGLFVAGKTVEQVQDELTKKLDEYIIDPKISVSLDKAVSARYAVLGDVGTPGMKIMTRRVSVYEAIAEAGGVLNTGDKSKVFIVRLKPDGMPMQIPVNLKDIERGRAKEMAFLVPGDQVFVPGNKLKSFQQIMSFTSILSFARLFTGGW